MLAGACEQRHHGLVVLTSRFPFADLEGFDGGRARMLDVPPFTPAEGSALLAAAGGGWLADDERRTLVRAVDGHALATGVLAGVLAARPPASDLVALRADLAAAARTDARVGRVLQFYAERLAEPDRYLLAAVSLFARPVPAAAVLAVAGHDAFGSRLAGWTSAMVAAVVRDRLGGLASWHPDGTISAHPLVRETFRPLVMDAARAAADTALAGLPAGPVTSRADALRVVEAIELLLDAGQWQPANDMCRSRTGSYSAFWTLPAARHGQRAVAAFVATPARRAACATHLSPDLLGFYLASTGLFAMNAGDLATAQEYFPIAIRHARDAGDMRNLAINLRNLTECLGQLGHTDPARDSAAEALTCAEAIGSPRQSATRTRSLDGQPPWSATSQRPSSGSWPPTRSSSSLTVKAHLYSLRGTQWAEWLARTGRPSAAWALTRRNAKISWSSGLERRRGAV